jgi:hypothetical protein
MIRNLLRAGPRQAPPGAARVASSGGSAGPGTSTRCNGGLWTNVSKKKATRSSAGNRGHGRPRFDSHIHPPVKRLADTPDTYAGMVSALFLGLSIVFAHSHLGFD